MKRNVLLASILATLGLAAIAGPASAVTVVTSTPELAAIAREVGGTKVSVESLAKPGQNYHQVEAKPTDVVKVAHADVYVRVGMDLDMWADSVLRAARNPKVQEGGPGYVDGGRLIKKLEIPTAQISGASGDIHVYGNPHYWLDPGNGKVIAYEILLGLRAVDPANGGYYNEQYTRFAADVDQNIKKWEARLASDRGKPVVAYHDEWIYFYTRFGLKPFGYLEPKPGIPPAPSHVQNLISSMKASGVKTVIVPDIYPNNFATLIAKETGGEVALVPYSVGEQGTTTYISYINAIVESVKKALD
ncbi:MAG TPA: metal ABC transporter substrate-binding protein [Capsulimonadaceae bacterium]|jgi:ABC-type Zn uptake system ZnuABC Zn-binding protein ZnuA